ncbi:CGNR zinc finger domain-containing protein [Mycolicibacterium goodii]|uniref:CGNR zinc finger domain-containing protein n=1 Tax=Mycolicibacterium goodii TaxID=134601 RepID=UPI001BDD5C9A|nr:CGNR zinc finger domain-containing protein [Mycolicibacterium goodii]MBU8809584.1 CGNR zinc finger domain-containing protein [Mycolicibacterium goodii]
MADTETAWVPEHFIGGHPALDLANTVFDRREPDPDNELLKSARDIGNWFKASGLAGARQAAAVSGIAGEPFVNRIHEVREASAEIFGAIAADKAPTAAALGLLFASAASGLADNAVDLDGTKPRLSLAGWRDPDVVTAALAMLSIEGFYTLPRERLRSCPRCEWLFLDTSRGGKRRWCSMQICGNREKVSRHREHA